MVSVLLIEDDPTIRKNYRRILEKKGFEVIDAVDGEQGIQKIKKNPIQLVLTDLQLPGISGVEVIKYLSQEFPHVKVIAMSAGIPNLLDDARENGANCTIKKNFDFKELILAINRVLQSTY